MELADNMESRDGAHEQHVNLYLVGRRVAGPELRQEENPGPEARGRSHSFTATP